MPRHQQTLRTGEIAIDTRDAARPRLALVRADSPDAATPAGSWLSRVVGAARGPRGDGGHDGGRDAGERSPAQRAADAYGWGM